MGPKASEARRGLVSLRAVTTVGEMKRGDDGFAFSGSKEGGESFVMSRIDDTSHSGGRVRAVGLRDGLVWESV